MICFMKELDVHSVMLLLYVSVFSVKCFKTPQLRSYFFSQLNKTKIFRQNLQRNVQNTKTS